MFLSAFLSLLGLGALFYGAAWVQIASLAGPIGEDRQNSWSAIRTNPPANDGQHDLLTFDPNQSTGWQRLVVY